MYRWQCSNFHVCVHKMLVDVNHALNCSTARFPTIPDNQSRDLQQNSLERVPRYDDNDVDSVLIFRLVVLLMVSMYNLFFWDDMWAMPLANGSIASDSFSATSILSLQAAYVHNSSDLCSYLPVC